MSNKEKRLLEKLELLNKALESGDKEEIKKTIDIISPKKNIWQRLEKK